MNKIAVLGAGLVGLPMALDLLKEEDYQVTIVDVSTDTLNSIQQQYDLQVTRADLSDPAEIKRVVAGFDLVVNAVPGFMGMHTLKNIIESGINVVDIAFSPENLNELNDLAIRHNATALVDFGVAPGLSHLIVAHAADKFDQLEKVRIYVGGLPINRVKPFEYAAVFSPVDVIEEYTRPARIIREGSLHIMEALSEIEYLNFDKVGTLEAFNSDGLRSLVDSIEVTDMAEKTLRYPGHAELMKIFRETGFFNKEKIVVDGHTISPLDMTKKLLFPKWQMKEGDRDLTIMKIFAEGKISGIHQRFEFDLYDEFDLHSGIHSMARTTGYTATMGVRALLNGLFTEKGLFYPEKLGTDQKILDFILDGLKDRGVQIKTSMKILG